MVYPYLNINGEILHRDKALIPVYDLGLLRGLGIFDFFRVSDGVPVFVENHLERMQQSMDMMNLKTPYSAVDWIERINELIRKNGVESAGFRIVVTGGFSEDGFSLPPEANVYMMLHFLPENDPVQYEQGISLLTSDYQRDKPRAKTTMYMQALYMQPVLKQAGAYEVLYHSDGLVRECSRCNIFFIDQDGVIHTPEQEMLKGITRRKVLEIAAEQGIELRERAIAMSELPHMAGAFLTATTKGVLPVVKIDDQAIGNGQVHPLAGTLQQAYLKKSEQYIAAARLAQMVL
jgi:D-alanine transaminase/branched-chain amino acid aminotransferase